MCFILLGFLCDICFISWVFQSHSAETEPVVYYRYLLSFLASIVCQIFEISAFLTLYEIARTNTGDDTDFSPLNNLQLEVEEWFRRFGVALCLLQIPYILYIYYLSTGNFIAAYINSCVVCVLFLTTSIDVNFKLFEWKNDPSFVASRRLIYTFLASTICCCGYLVIGSLILTSN
jgi:hypothetical protein